VVLEEIGEDKMINKITSEQVLEHIGEERTLLNNILHRKPDLIGRFELRMGEKSPKTIVFR
jgi:hypothetical protein